MNYLDGWGNSSHGEEFDDWQVAFQAHRALQGNRVDNSLDEERHEGKGEDNVLVTVHSVPLDPIFVLIWQEFEEWFSSSNFEILQK